MSANFQRIAIDLGRQLQTRFPSLRKSTADDKPIDGVNLKDQDARKFNFDFVDESGVKLVNVTVSLNEDDDGGPGLDVQWSEQVDNKAWDRFIRTILPKFAQTHGLNFNAQNPSQSNLDKRHSIGEGKMNESKLFGTSKTSYQQIGEAKIIVRHTQPINLNSPNGRTQHIEHIYVENAMGERFLYPVKHLNGARAMARHMSEGGSFFDDIGNYVIGLSEELSKLKVFKNYVDRSPVVSESMSNIQEKVINRITGIKEEIHALQTNKYYSQFKESFSAYNKVEVPEDILNDWIDRLTVRSFNEELKDAFPYIYRLVDETQLPIKELSADDILEDDKEKKYDDNDPPFDPDPPKKKKEAGDKAEHGGHSRAKHLAKSAMKDVKEFSVFEKYLNQIVSENDLLSGDEEVQNQAMQTLKQLFSNEVPLGTGGANAIDSVSEILDEKKLNKAFELLGELGLDEMDARPIISEFLKAHDKQNGTTFHNQLGYDSGSAPPPPPEPAAPPAAPPPEAAPAPVDPAAMAAPAAPPIDPMAAAGGAAPGPMIPNPPMMEGRVMHKIVDEIFSRVSGFFNENNGTFTIGEHGFVTKMCKELKEKYHIDPRHPKSEMFDRMVEGACARIMEKMKQKHQAESDHARMLELAGMMQQEERKTMSQHAKGNEKYGKDGMQALRDKAQSGASEKEMDATRDQYNKYDEVRGNIDADQAGFYVVDDDGNAVSGPFASKQEAYERAAEMGRMYDVKYKGDVIPLDSLIRKIIKTLPPDVTSDDLQDPMDLEQQLEALRSPLLQIFSKLSPYEQAEVTDEVANHFYDRRPGGFDEGKQKGVAEDNELGRILKIAGLR